MKYFIFIFYFIGLLSLWSHAEDGLRRPHFHPHLRLVENPLENSVVNIVSSNSSIKGIGYFISKNVVVTHFQTLMHTNFQNPVYVENKLGKAQVKRVTHLSVLHNIAVLEIADHPAPPLSIGNTLQYESYVLSYIDGKPHKFIGTGTQLREGLIHFFAEEDMDMKAVDGSPILNNKGQVVGMITDSVDNIIIGTFIQDIRRLLRKPSSPPSATIKEMIAREQHEFESLTAGGNVAVLFRIARYFDRGSSKNQAAKWYQEAAKKNHALSQHILGDRYIIGENSEKGFQWIEAAVHQGFFGAYAMFGFMLFEGLGTTQNIDRGIEWLETAAELGDIKALDILKDIAEEGNVEAQKSISYLTYNANDAKKCSRSFRLLSN